ncbi:receptor-like protein kinase FERONIA [Aegilops tauschii subsp. strangulata]|uniref:receptor-like protein kinase FERONIA n=1 Tax=Aegilops tauschii subsp. strangulata TaxID=200361 RepID=UPI00098B67B0
MADTARHPLLILLAVVAATAIIVAISVVVVLYHKRNKRKKNRELSDAGSRTSARWLPQYNSYAVGKSFTFEEIREATSNFAQSLVIGVGGFGKVFCGVVDDGTKKVAIKRWNPSPEQSMHEVQAKIEALSKLQHPHLVSLIGFCLFKKEMILVWEYMEHGTLREHLYNNSGKPVLSCSWRHRLHMCIGAARGLHYLHTGGIIHRNVKTTTILIDKNWVAKVSDFGFPKSALTRASQMHLSTSHVNGSYGYTDPEYFCREQLTDKSDVYSFGVVLFEVLMARTALNPALPSDQVSLANYALACQRNGTLPDAVDPVIKDEITPECLEKFAETAVKCLADQGMERPTMGGVLSNLELAMQLLNSMPMQNKPLIQQNHMLYV